MDRRTFLAGTTAAASLAVAGCLGGSDDSDASLTDTGPARGQVVSNTVDGIEVVGLESEVGTKNGSKQFSVDVTVENTGQETTDPTDYTYEIALFDASGSELSTRGLSTAAFGRRDVGNGGRVTITLTPMLESAAPDDVARYELSVNCSGMRADGVYCDGTSS